MAIFAQCDGHIISKTKLPGFCPVLCFTKCYTISFLFCVSYYKDFLKIQTSITGNTGTILFVSFFLVFTVIVIAWLLVLNPPE